MDAMGKVQKSLCGPEGEDFGADFGGTNLQKIFIWKLDTFGLRNPDDVILLQALLEMESIL